MKNFRLLEINANLHLILILRYSHPFWQKKCDQERHVACFLEPTPPLFFVIFSYTMHGISTYNMVVVSFLCVCTSTLSILDADISHIFPNLARHTI